MKKNLLYSLIYELVIAFYPILLIPYLSRTIGKSGVGIYSYTYSIVGFFLLLCQLGVNTCGTRAIAQTRDNKDEMTRTFKSIFLIQILISLFTILIFLVYITIGNKEYKLYFMLLLPFIIGQAIRISWFFLGLEQIGTILLRNVLIRIVSATLIILFVKSEDSLKLYFIIMSMSYLLGDLSVWPTATKKLSSVPFSMDIVKKYIKPMFVMFLPLLALRGSYYIDEVMLGIFHDTDSVAIYENAYKIVNMPLQLYTVLANVLTAQASHLVAIKKEKQNVEYVINSIDLSSSLMIPIIIGLIACAREFVPWYMGEEFISSIQVLHILPCVLIFSGITSILRTQYFIPMEQDERYVGTVFIGVIINICLNIALIPRFNYWGVALATVISEAIITIISIIIINKKYSIFKAFRHFPLYLEVGLFMAFMVRLIGNYLSAGIKTNVIQIISGMVIYLSLIFLIQKLFYKKESVNLQKVCRNIMSKRKVYKK